MAEDFTSRQQACHHTGVAVMVVSGLGAVFLAGPIGGGIVGAATGAFLGGLGGWGVHGEQMRRYEKLVKEGIEMFDRTNSSLTEGD